jgi:small GTP-binding protein
MGIIFSQLDKLWQSFHRDSAILILGLDNAGKTAVLYALHLGESIEYTVPTIGFNIEEVTAGNLSIKMWDLGGQERLRALWPHYFGQSDGVIFVVDSSDIDRIDVAKTELHTLMSHKELTGKPFLILANKQDLPRALDKQNMIEALGLSAVTWLKWQVVECSATKNNRAKLGLEWLAEEI